MANLYYVNLHSSTFTAGEIRGQLVKELQPLLILGRFTKYILAKSIYKSYFFPRT
jgi:hypothetical protein